MLEEILLVNFVQEKQRNCAVQPIELNGTCVPQLIRQSPQICSDLFNRLTVFYILAMCMLLEFAFLSTSNILSFKSPALRLWVLHDILMGEEQADKTKHDKAVIPHFCWLKTSSPC